MSIEDAFVDYLWWHCRPQYTDAPWFFSQRAQTVIAEET